MTLAARLGAVVPTLDEAKRLPLLLADLAPTGIPVVVADGGSTDGTPEIARSLGATVVETRRGRARQLRAGAGALETPWLFFVHADCRLPRGAIDAMERFLDAAATDDFAHFRFALQGTGGLYRFLEFGQRLRERLAGLAYGDQGLVVSRTLYRRVGGYPEWPILEDVGLLERLGRAGRRHRLDSELLTSPRRYDQEGGIREWLRNSAIIALYRLGVSPTSLARRFPRPPTGKEPDRVRRTVVVFAKAPRPGHVKTRLAADVGEVEAARIYRALGRATVDALRTAPARVVVYYDPPDRGGLQDVSVWLGPGIEYRPQSGADLGERLERAVAETLAEAEEVCVVGTDVPDLGVETVSAAFDALSRNDLVVGPATDGGYYLIGLRRPWPQLFRGVAWSTPTVLETTLSRASDMGAEVALLDPKTDVDTGVDVPAGLRSA